MRMVMQNFKAAEKQVYDGSSIGSSMSNHYTHRDTLKKIRHSIKSKSAPLNLKIAMGLVAMSFFFCIGVNILTYELLGQSNQAVREFVWNTKNLTEILIKFNKLNAYVEYSKIQANFSTTNDFELIYDQKVTDKIHLDVSKTLSSLLEIKDYMITTSISNNSLSPIVEFFFYQRRTYTTQSGVKSLPTVTFIDQSLNLLYNYISNGYGNQPLQSYAKLRELNVNRTISDNQNEVLDFNLKYFEKTVELSKNLANHQLLLGILDIAIRTLLVLVALSVSLPMLYLSMQKSSEILHIISRISANNIQFYNNHYNKLISLLNNESQNLEGTIEKVAESYRLGLKEKERKDKQNVNKKLKITKEYERNKGLWLLSGFFIFAGLVAMQCSKSVVSIIAMLDLKTSVEAIIKIPNTINSYSAINMVTFKLLSYPIFSVAYDDTFNRGFDLMNKVVSHQQFFAQTVNSKDTIGESRLQIKDSKFEDVFMKLFTKDLCQTIFGTPSSPDASADPFYKCDAVVSKYAKHNLKAFFSFYQTSSWSRITYIESKYSGPVVKGLLRQGMFMETFYLFYW